MNMKFSIWFYAFCLLLVTLTSCSSYKKVPYLQTGDQDFSEISLSSLYAENIVRFQPDDVLSITINLPGEQAVAYDFNLPIQPSATSENSGEDIFSSGVGRQTYQVNKKGEIDFPFLGSIKVSGYTKDELEVYFKESLRKFLKVDPIVTIRLLNFRISILGEVRKPGQYSVSKDHLNILEALTLAGDMSLYGKRDNVRLMRLMPDGDLKIVQLDISSADIVSSPYFYLHQDDMLYVQPNKTLARSSDIGSQTNILFNVASILISLASLIVVITNK